MIIWVAELTAKVLNKENVFVATDDKRIVDAVNDHGFNAVLTSDLALTGTDRVWEVAKQIEADMYINVQGDEPLLEPSDIHKIIAAKERFPKEVINGMCPIAKDEDPKNVNIPKVVTTEDLHLIYMSRSPIPASKSTEAFSKTFWKQVCIYAFSKKELKLFGEFGRKSYLEDLEDIEILRFLEVGIPVRMVKVSGNSRAVDVPEDVRAVEVLLKDRHND